MDDITEGPVLVRRDGDLHWITLNRPNRLNAIDAAMHEALVDLLPRVDRDPQTKVMIMAGAGRGFCSGGDIKIAQAKLQGEDVRTVWDVGQGRINPPGRELIDILLRLEKPSVAMVNGPAAGLGANLALLMDSVVMAEDAVIGDTHVTAGLVAGDGAAVIWPLLVGPNRAKEFLMTGRLLTGPEAQQVGLVARCMPAGDLETVTRQVATEFARMPVYATRATKALVNKQLQLVAAQLMDTSLAYEHISHDLPDRPEAVRAFMASRDATTVTT
jgi:enoyl-CoA hydratase